MRPGPSRPWAISNPRPSPSRMLDAGTRTFSKLISAWPCGASSKPNTGSMRWMVTPGVFARHQDHGLLAVLVHVVGSVLPMTMNTGAARVASAGGPPFPAVDHVVVAVPHDRRLDIGRVGGGDGRFGHAEGAADLALQQRREPLRLLLLRPVELQRFHVAGVGGGAVEHFGRPLHPAHDLRQRGVFQVAQPGAAFAVGQEQVPQPLRLARLLLQASRRSGPAASGRARRAIWAL